MDGDDGFGAAQVERFFVFNSSWGPREGEEPEKIVYYCPAGDSEEVRCKHVGLVEAVAKFAAVFSRSPARLLHGQKAKMAFMEMSGYTLALGVSVPCRARTRPDGSSREAAAYAGELAHDNVIRAKLSRAYDMFEFFTGGFDVIASKNKERAREAVRTASEAFFSRYFANASAGLNLAGELFGAVQFLTLEPSDFLHVGSFVNRVEDEFPAVDKCAFFHNGNVVWTGLQQHETQLLFQYLYATLLPASGDASHVRPGSSPSSSSSSPFEGHQGRFLAGPECPAKLKADQLAGLRVPTVRTRAGGGKEHHLLVYHALKSTLALLVPAEVAFTVDFFKRLDGHLGPRLTNMSADLLDVFGRNSNTISTMAAPSDSRSAQPDPPSILSPTSPGSETALVTSDGGSNKDVKLVYFNRANKAMMNTTPVSVGEAKVTTDDDDVQHAIADVTDDLDRLDILCEGENVPRPTMSSEIAAKLSNDHWLIGRKSGQREVFVSLQSKNVNLADAATEVESVMTNEFKKIFMPK